MNEELIYDWNLAAAPAIAPGARVLLNDETLRDGLQNPSVVDPNIEEKIEILHLMESLGIDSVNIGLPGAGPRAAADTEALAREIATNRMKIQAELRGANGGGGHFAHCGNFPARGDRDGSRDFFGVKSHTAIGGRLDCGSSGAHHRESGELRGGTRAAVHVRDGRHHSNGRGDGEAAVQLRDSQWRAGHRVVRHGGTRHAERRLQPGEICR